MTTKLSIPTTFLQAQGPPFRVAGGNLTPAKNGSILPMQHPGIVAPNGRPVVSQPDPDLPESWLLKALAMSIRDAQFRGSYMRAEPMFQVQCGIKRDGGYLLLLME